VKKIFGLIIILLGGLVIGGGIFIQVSGKDVLLKKQQPKDSVISRADAKDKELLCDNKMEETYIQLNDLTKITFSYPECVKEKRLSYKNKQLISDDYSLRLDVTTATDNPKAFLNSEKTSLVSLSQEKNYEDFNYTEIQEMENNGIKYYYFNVTYYSVSLYDNYKTLRDEWYIAIPFKNKKSKEERIIKITFKTTDKAISPNAIKKIISSIKIEENKADFTHSKVDGDYLVGSIKQNKFDSFDHGYILNYKFPKDISETAVTSTDIGSVAFALDDVGKSKYITLSIESGKENIKEKTESYFKSVTENENKNENYKNHQNTGVKFKSYNNYNMYYFITSYDYYNPDTKEFLFTNYTLYCYVEISENNYVKIYMSNMSIPLSEKDLEKYLNFTIEEY